MHCRYQVVTLDGIGGLHNLKRLALCSGINSLNPVSSLSQLEELILQDTAITDLTPLAELGNLKRLEIRGSNVGDLSPLKNLQKLETLIISDSNVKDLTPIKDLTNIRRLFLHNNRISDITPLAGLTQLTMLNLSGNQITDVMPIANKQGLTNLYLARNQVSDIRPLAALPNLIGLDLRCNPAGLNGQLSLLENLLWVDLRCTDIINPEVTDQCITHCGRADEICLYVNGICLNPDQPPIVESGCTLLPVSAVAKALGADIVWNAHTKTVIMTYRDDILRMPVNRSYAYHNGDRIDLYYQTQIRNGRTMVHSRLLLEAFDARIHFDAENRIVLINTE